MSRTTACVVLIVAGAFTVAASAWQAPTRFEVASVKPDPKQDRGGWQSFGEFTLTVVQVLPGGRVA